MVRQKCGRRLQALGGLHLAKLELSFRGNTVRDITLPVVFAKELLYRTNNQWRKKNHSLMKAKMITCKMLQNATQMCAQQDANPTPHDRHFSWEKALSEHAGGPR